MKARDIHTAHDDNERGSEDPFAGLVEVKARYVLTIWLLVVALLVLLAAAPFVLDGPDEFTAARDTAATVADAVADAQRIARYERVAP